MQHANEFTPYSFYDVQAYRWFSHNRRCMSADPASIRAIKKRMLVVQEDNKFESLIAALKGGFASHVIVTTSMARPDMDRWRRDGLEGALPERGLRQ